MSGNVLRLAVLGCLAVGLYACGGSSADPASAPTPGAGGSGVVSPAGGGGVGSPVGGAGPSSSGGASAGGVASTGGSGAGGVSSGGAGPVVTGGSGGVSTAGGGAGGSGTTDPSNPGNYPAPPREINVQSKQKVSISFSSSAADPASTGGGHKGEFDPTKPLQKKLVVPMGGVQSDPWTLGWAVDRGYHVITVGVWNDYPNDPGYPEYLESWSGEDVSPHVTQPAANSVMARVKAGLKYLQGMDPGSDWGYYLDAAGEVRWNDVIVFGYSFGGQMGVAASKYIAADRIIITSAPNVPIDSPWLVQMPAKTPVERCFFLGGNKDGEHKTHKDETALLKWPGEVLNVTHMPPPYPTNRLEVDDGHSSFCGRPFADGMVDWDSICEFMFHTKK